MNTKPTRPTEPYDGWEHHSDKTRFKSKKKKRIIKCKRYTRTKLVGKSVEWPDIIAYSWAPKRQNLNTDVIRMFKNKREKALICLEGIDKTRFPDFPKSHLMFWTTGFSWGMLNLQLQPKNRKFYEVFALSFCVPKLGTNRLFQRETCTRYEVKSDF